MEKSINTRRITNTSQFELLIKLMEDNPEIARGFTGYSYSGTKLEYGRIWKNFADSLNAIGPPIRDGEGWLKVWNDFKNKVRKKLIFNKKEIATTGGDPNRFQKLSNLEEAANRILGLTAVSYTSGDTFSIENTNTETKFEEPEIMEPTNSNASYSPEVKSQTETEEIYIKSDNLVDDFLCSYEEENPIDNIFAKTKRRKINSTGTSNIQITSHKLPDVNCEISQFFQCLATKVKIENLSRDEVDIFQEALLSFVNKKLAELRKTKPSK